MRRILLALTIAGAAAALLPGPALGQVVQLRTGEVLVGKVDAHEDGLTVERADNGGVLELRWEQLSESSATRLKTLFSLTSEDEGEFMVDAELVRYELPGGGITEIAGLTDPSWDTAQTITVRSQGVPFPIKRESVRQRTTVQRPALDVYTRDEFYNERLQYHDPGEDADRHVMLADDLSRGGDYERALQHLEKAQSLGGGRQPSALEGRIKRLELFHELAAEREVLDGIRVAMAREDFAKGRELIEDFQKRHAGSKLQSEFARIAQRFERERERHLVTRLTELWYKEAYNLARAKATDASVSFEAARDYAESGLGQDIRRIAQERLGIARDEVDALWGKRLEQRGGPRAQQFGYGMGSWLLGAEAILANTKQEDRDDQHEETEQEKEQRKTAERIQRARERARRATAQQGGGAKSSEETPDDWWKDATADQRAVWLRAYYAERGGDLELVSASLSNCSYCAGFGKETIVGDSGKVQKVDCPTCHGTRFTRTIRAR
jgi:hypothetical protein